MTSRNSLLEKLGTEIVDLYDSFHDKSWGEIYERCNFICFHKEIITQILKCNFSDELIKKIVEEDNFLLNLYSYLNIDKPYFEDKSYQVEALIIDYLKSKKEE